MTQTPEGPVGRDGPAGRDGRDAPLQLAPDRYQIDTRTGGMTQVTAGYLLAAQRPALVECGPALSIQAVIDGLRSLGLDADDLAYLVLSHIHLDHAGGAGDVARAFPRATVVVSELGARHIVDPERLNASSRRVYGDFFDTVYGACSPVAAQRVLAVGEAHSLDLGGGATLELRHAPGHAKHHLSVFEPSTGALYSGDSVGIQMPGMTAIRPATPPPDFDLELSRQTLAGYRELQPRHVYLAHYGAVDEPGTALEEAADRLEQWATVAGSAWREQPEVDHVAAALRERFAAELRPVEDDEEAERRVALLSGYESNAAGLVRYFETREDDATH